MSPTKKGILFPLLLPVAYEFVVNRFSNERPLLVADDFFPDIVNPQVERIVVNPPPDRPWTWPFEVLKEGLHPPGYTAYYYGPVHTNYDAWVLTDAPPVPEDNRGISVAEITRILQARRVRPYFFVLGDCSTGKSGEKGGTISSKLPRFSPESMEQCVENYAPVAALGNGQFLLIDQGQLSGAAEIVRAFMDSSAGSGRYTNYVSSDWTYTWQEVPYQWYDASLLGTALNISDRQAVALPQSFSFYNTPYTTAYIAAPGYVAFSDFPAVFDNTSLPTAAAPNHAIYAFWDNISAYVPGDAMAVYADYDVVGHRYVVEWSEAYHRDNPAVLETFETILDFNTGVITLQYANVGDGSSATAGVENEAGSAATQVFYNSASAVHDGLAISLTPRPPQPTRDHPVLVDSTITATVFMLTGYSGNVELTVYRPDGTPVNPTDPDVHYISIGRLRYYRVSNPAVGTWVATASGNGTYHFTSSSSSVLVATLHTAPAQTTAVPALVQVDLGMAVSAASFSMIDEEGTFVAALDLYDDGAHDDGDPNDGLYAGTCTPPGEGTYYVKVDGATPGGQSFTRVADYPLTFQPMQLSKPYPDDRFALPGEAVVYTFLLYNDSDSDQTFLLDLSSSQGWASLPYTSTLVTAHSWTTVDVTVQVSPTARGLVDQTLLIANAGQNADSALVTTRVRGITTRITLLADPAYIAPGGYQATIVALVTDDSGWAVADGTPVFFQTDLGILNPTSGTTIDGQVTTTLTSDSNTGIATVQVDTGGVFTLTTVEISSAPACSITVEPALSYLSPDGSSTLLLTAHVYDQYNAPAPDGSTVVFGLEGDGLALGDLYGQEVYTTTTSGGAAYATFRSGTTPGVARIRVEIPMGQGKRWANSTVIMFGNSYSVYLPIVFANRAP